jgi:putative ABC transport system substrate-binding protein
MRRLSRRQLVVGAAGLGLMAGCGRLPWQAQPPKVHRIGWLGLLGTGTGSQMFENIREALRELGYVEGQSIVIHRREAPSREALWSLAAELAALPVDVIVTVGITATQAARDATSTVPIVQALGADLVQVGLAASLARPGGNVTGLTELGGELMGKRVELLKSTVPGMSRLAVLWNGGNPTKALELRDASAAGTTLGLQTLSLEVHSSAELEGAFDRAASEQADGLLVLGDGLLNAHRGRVTELAAQSRLPAIYGERVFMETGGLMTYVAHRADGPRRVADYVDRILKGARPADLPIERPMRFDFIVNMKTARELGITFPHEVALQITEVIE